MTMTDNAKPTTTPDAVLGLAARIKRAGEQASLATSGTKLDLQTRRAFDTLRVGGDDATRQTILDLEEAESAAFTDPFVREETIKAKIATMAGDHWVDPFAAANLFWTALATHMPKSRNPTRPLFKAFGTMSEAREHCGRSGLPRNVAFIVVPHVWRDNEETADEWCRINGQRYVVPHMRGDVETFHQMTAILARAGDALAISLESEYLANLREWVWTILRITPRSSLTSRSRIDESYTKVSETVVERDGRRYEHFELSPREVLLLVQNPLNTRIVARLHELRAVMNNFWADRIDTDVALLSIIRENPHKLLSPSEFLEGKTGMVGIMQSWGKGKKRARANALFERREDGYWRVVIYNPHTAETLLRSREGAELQFTTWTTPRRMPMSVQEFLRTGDTIRRPADLGLTEEAMEAIAKQA